MTTGNFISRGNHKRYSTGLAKLNNTKVVYCDVLKYALDSLNDFWHTIRLFIYTWCEAKILYYIYFYVYLYLFIVSVYVLKESNLYFSLVAMDLELL